jgi:DNA-binding IclR family transcriptional regulator
LKQDLLNEAVEILNAPPLTESVDHVLKEAQELAMQGKSLRQIAAQLGMSKDRVARLGVKTLAATRPRGRPKNLQLLNDVQALMSFGQTNASEIARQLNAPRSTVQRMMKEECP